MHWAIKMLLPYIIPMILDGVRVLVERTDNTFDDYVLSRFGDKNNQHKLINVIIEKKFKVKKLT